MDFIRGSPIVGWRRCNGCGVGAAGHPGVRMRIEVNADDVGLTHRINAEAFDLVSQGLVNSCSVIANAPFTTDAIRNARRFRNCRFGIHLNLSDFAPLNPTPGLEPLLDGNGQFLYNVLWQRRKTKELRRVVYLEWSAQIEQYILLGLRPAHLDSHHEVPLT